ncbi:MAG TPA: helix-turn-helix transcriptional regulator [Gaiellaceae bacterium]|jgi:transcriptional regulator with XRE-family HTH domain
MPRTPYRRHIDDADAFAIRFRNAREKAGLSQRRLSFPGCSPAYISRIEGGARVPSLHLIHELAGRLGVSPEWLATGTDSDPSAASTRRALAEVKRLRAAGGGNGYDEAVDRLVLCVERQL